MAAYEDIYVLKDILVDSGNRLNMILEARTKHRDKGTGQFNALLQMKNIDDALVSMVSMCREYEVGTEPGKTGHYELKKFADKAAEEIGKFRDMVKGRNADEITDDEVIDILTPICKEFADLKKYVLEYISGTYIPFRYEFERWDRFFDVSDCWPTAASFISSLMRQDRKFNVLQMIPRTDDTLFGMFVDAMSDKAEMYGVYKYDSLTNYLKELRNNPKVKRIVIGEGGSSAAISNDIFDVVIGTAKVTFTRQPNRVGMVFEERRTLRKLLNYVRPGGIVFYFVPYTRLALGLCMDIAKAAESVRVYRNGDSSDDETRDNGLVILAIRTNDEKNKLISGTVNAAAYNLLHDICLNYDSIPTEEKPETYELSGKKLDVPMFRGAKLEPDEIIEMASLASTKDDFWKSQRVEKISDNARRSLLPFSIGQLGIVLTSGCMDGVVHEGNHCSHLVKGRVIKITDESSEVDSHNHDISVKEKKSNRVEINMFMPDGEYKRLA